MKVSIIGGGGLVGSCTGFALQAGGIVREIVLIDANAELAAGQALDLLHGSSLVADQMIRSGGYDEIPASDVICITAGLRRKPDESRLDLINRNVDLFLGILERNSESGHQARRNHRRRLEPGRRAHLPRRAATRPSAVASHRPGHTTRHASFPQPDRRETWRAADASVGRDPRRTRRQHGADLVERDGRRPAAGEISRLVDQHCQRSVQPHEGLGRGSHQEEGGAGFAVGLAIKEVIEAIALDRNACCRFPACKTAATVCATCRSRCRPSSVAKALSRRARSSFGRSEAARASPERQVLRQTIDTVLARIGKAS